jgi:hypothetical protein
MVRQSKLTPEQIAQVEEMLKAGVKVPEIVKATGAKDYQINTIKRRMGLVRPRKIKGKSTKTEKSALPKTPSRRVAGALTVNDIRVQLETAQKEVIRWQEQLIAHVAEIEKMIAAIKKS